MGWLSVFCHHWYNSEPVLDFPNDHPYELSFGVPDSNFVSPSGNLILVTKEFDIMLHRLLDLRERDKWGDARGAVITGQPGTGASLQPDLHPMRDSPVDPFSRENHLPNLHARAVDFSSPGRALL